MIRGETRYGKLHFQTILHFWLINGQIDMSNVESSEQVRYEHGQLESLDIDGLLSFSAVIMISTDK
jgi:hypothetical protein